MNRFTTTMFAVCFSISAVLLLMVDLPDGSLFWSALQNSGHTLVFALLTGFCVLVIPTDRCQYLPRLSAILLLLIVLFGIAVEFIQGLLGRDASIEDVLLNISGIVIAILICLAIRMQGRKPVIRWSLVMMGCAILIFNFRHPVRYAFASIMQPALPVLADFESVGALIKTIGLRNSSIELVEDERTWPGNHSRFLQVDFSKGIWPGVSLLEPHPNWGDYAEVSFQTLNPTHEPIEVVLRIHDAFHNDQVSDRFRQTLVIKPGPQIIKIPIEHIQLQTTENKNGRQLDIKNIKGLIIFKSFAQPGATLYFDNFKLL